MAVVPVPGTSEPGVRGGESVGDTTADAAASAVPDTAGQPEVVLDVQDLRIVNTIGQAELVKGLSFSLRRGQALGIVGESGSGKTLTIPAVLGILPEQLKQAGETVQILGRSTAGFSKQDWLDVRGNTISAMPAWTTSGWPAPSSSRTPCCSAAPSPTTSASQTRACTASGSRTRPG